LGQATSTVASCATRYCSESQSALQETGDLARSKHMVEAKLTKHGDKFRIGWVDERGKRQSAVFDDCKRPGRAQPTTGRGRVDPGWRPKRPATGKRTLGNTETRIANSPVAPRLVRLWCTSALVTLGIASRRSSAVS